MSTRFDIEFIFDKKRLDELPEMLDWVSDHSVPRDKPAEVKFGEGNIKNFNFSSSFPNVNMKFDFSKGISEDNDFTASFTVKRTKDLEKDLMTKEKYTKEDLELNEKNCKVGCLCLGYFYLSVYEENNDFVIVFNAATFKLGDLFANNKTTRRFLLDFCKKFNPKEAYTEIEDVKDEVFWPPRRSRR